VRLQLQKTLGCQHHGPLPTLGGLRR